jgi:hypothetical protein
MKFSILIVSILSVVVVANDVAKEEKRADALSLLDTATGDVASVFSVATSIVPPHPNF